MIGLFNCLFSTAGVKEQDHKREVWLTKSKRKGRNFYDKR